MSPDLLAGFVLGMLFMLWLDHAIFPLIAHRMSLARLRSGGR